MSLSENNQECHLESDSSVSSVECFQVLLRCPICLEQYKDPRMLPCQHSFCLQCLSNISDSRWGRCPICRRLFRVPIQNGIQGLDVNRTIVGLLESCKQQQKRKELCKKQSVEQNGIRSNGTLRYAEDKNLIINARCSECKKDGKLRACAHCRDVLCDACRHDHYSQLSNYLNYKLNEVEESTNHLMNKHEENIKLLQEVSDSCNDVAELVNVRVDNIKSLLDEQKQCLIEQLEERKKQVRSEIAENGIHMKQFSKIRLFCQSSKQDLQCKSETDRSVLGIIRQCESYVIATKEFENLTITNAKKPNLSKVSFIEKPLDIDEFTIGYLNDKENDKVQNPNKQAVAIPYRKFSTGKRIKQVDFAKTSAIFQFPLGIASTSNLLYAADAWTNTIQCWLLTESKKLIKLWQNQNNHLQHPFAIHVSDLYEHGEKRLIILDSCPKYPIKIFSMSMKLLRAIQGPAFTKTAFVDLTTSSEEMFVCDAFSNCIWKFEYSKVTPRWCQYIGKYGSGPGQFCCPVAVLLDKALLYVSDWGNRRIQVFEEDQVKMIFNFHSAERPGTMDINPINNQLMALCINDSHNKKRKSQHNCGSIVTYTIDSNVMKEQNRIPVKMKPSRKLWGMCVPKLTDGKVLTVAVSDYGSHKIRLIMNNN